MSDREVKTRQTFEEWIKSEFSKFHGMLQTSVARAAWNAALASVILPEGRFEVGDRARNYAGSSGVIGWIPDDGGAPWVDKILSDEVEPLPKAVDLTVEEKIDELVTRGLGWRYIAVVTNSGKKTLDDLCAKYNVPTTKELS